MYIDRDFNYELINSDYNRNGSGISNLISNLFTGEKSIVKKAVNSARLLLSAITGIAGGTMSDLVELKTQPSQITEKGDAWIIHMPRFGEEGMHYHTW